ALGDVVVHAETAALGDPPPVDVLARRHRAAPGRTRALDPEEVVILGGQLTLAPPGLVDRLRDRDGRRHAVLALCRHGPRCDLVDEGLLGRGARRLCCGRDVSPGVSGRAVGLGAGLLGPRGAAGSGACGKTRDGGAHAAGFGPARRGKPAEAAPYPEAAPCPEAAWRSRRRVPCRAEE